MYIHVLQYVENNVAVFLLDEIFIKVKEKYDMVMLMVSDLWQVCGFLWVLQFPPPIKLTAMI
jgi:hypothetical protein